MRLASQQVRLTDRPDDWDYPALVLALADYWPQTPRKIWTRRALVGESGATYWMLRRWEKNGWLVPVKVSRRSLFNVLDTTTAKLLLALRDWNVGSQIMQAVAETLRFENVLRARVLKTS